MGIGLAQLNAMKVEMEMDQHASPCARTASFTQRNTSRMLNMVNCRPVEIPVALMWSYIVLDLSTDNKIKIL